LLKANQETKKPFLIIGKTVMGKGSVTETGESFEHKVSTHGQPISKAGASAEKTILNLGGDPENPFVIFPEVKEAFDRVKSEKSKYIAKKKAEYEQWQKENPELAQKLTGFLNGDIPDIDFSGIDLKPGIATRAASSAVLAEFAHKVENMVVISADLSNSDKTDGFLKNSKPFSTGDFSGAFLNAGVSELSMAAISNGMALHNIIPVCGTFFVFSDYMKPAVRMAALMELPVKYVWTHDSFRVGEDGPTHQPVEQEAQIRLMEKLKNHSGENSMLVLRPADATEAVVGWKMALENKKTPTALILSRQGIKDLPVKPGSDRYTDTLQSYKGAYIVREPESRPDVILVADGSEVATLIEGAEILKEKKNLNVRVVSVISEGLFRNQSAEYQDKILPADVPRFGLTAGLPVTLEGLVGCNGKVVGMNHFGYSAPYNVLDEKFGFSGEDVYSSVVQLLFS
jgi:transketolase